MNFYKHHLGDYADATAHLSWDEDLAYRRLLSVYYRNEGPIPVSQAYRLVRAVTPAQKKAVAAVLREFFTNGDGCWKNSRADEEIAAYQHQAATNRRIARERFVNDSSTKGQPSQIPDTKNQIPRTKNQKDQKKGQGRATPLPANFKISERVKIWADAKGLTDLESDLEFFVGRMKANGKTYVDWDEAFMNCVREDWAGLREGKR